MKRKSSTTNMQGVLRNVVVHAEPHMLLKPGYPTSKQKNLKEDPVVPVQIIPQVSKEMPAIPEKSVNQPENFEQIFQTSKQEGYKAGHERGMVDGLAQGSTKGYEEGFKQGVEKGKESAEKSIAQAIDEVNKQAVQALNGRLQRVDAILKMLSEKATAHLMAAEDDMIALCHEVICQIFGELAVTPEGIRMHLRRALQACAVRTEIAVHLHPDDAKLMRQAERLAPESERLLHSGVSWEWVADPEVEMGGCILCTSEGGLDARLETQLENLRATLLQVRSEGYLRVFTPENAGKTGLENL